MTVTIKKQKMVKVKKKKNKSLNKAFKTMVCISHIPITVHIKNVYRYAV